jgi:hypothetical protein
MSCPTEDADTNNFQNSVVLNKKIDKNGWKKFKL